MNEARLWKRQKGDTVQCRLCSHYCVIPAGERGRCGVRENQAGTLMTLVYDRVAAINLDPVEKKPLYHFMPGSATLSLGTNGCNLNCSFCQNSDLSQTPRQFGRVEGQAVSPQRLVDAALARGAASVSYTYSEPTVFFELMADTASLAHEQGLRNIMVSNGFMSRECLDELAGLIDAANIDLKAFSEAFYKEQCGGALKPVLENLKTIRSLGWWLEVTTLVIPGLNDSEPELRDLARFIHDELGSETPWHVSRFHPTFRLSDCASTPTSTLERAWEIGRDAGLSFVYVGNVPGAQANSTFCPDCGSMLLDRQGCWFRSTSMSDGRCGECGREIAGEWS
ncbi:MAG: AmmeMemoRadiSam system radical SAM enzyme [Desulfovibrionaceae bacterium]